MTSSATKKQASVVDSTSKNKAVALAKDLWWTWMREGIIGNTNLRMVVIHTTIHTAIHTTIHAITHTTMGRG